MKTYRNTIALALTAAAPALVGLAVASSGEDKMSLKPSPSSQYQQVEMFAQAPKYSVRKIGNNRSLATFEHKKRKAKIARKSKQRNRR